MKARHRQKGGKHAKRGRGRAREARSEGPTQATATRTPQAAKATTRPSRRWWEVFSGRRELEVAELRDAGFEPEEYEADGRLHIRCVADIGGSRRQLVIRYPDLYPYFRFEVFAPTDTGLAKHQNPFGGNLCLLDQSTAAWSVDDTASSILTSQLPRITEANKTSESRPDLESAQPEPVSAYLSVLAGSAIVVPSEAFDRRRRPRAMRVAIQTVGEAVQGYVTAIESGTSLPDLTGAFAATSEVVVKCAHLEGPPPSGDATELFTYLLDRRFIQEPQLSPGEFALDAVSFDEEVTYGQPAERGWIFLFWRAKADALQGSLVRADRYDANEQGMRIPAAAGLRSAKVALFGLGGIGAPIAHLLMQSRVGELRLIDHDSLSVGNAVRWPLGFTGVGRSKVETLAAFAKANYPETTVRPIEWRVGASALGPQSDERILLETALAGTSLVIDATAEPGVQLLLADACRDRAVTLITTEGREGGYGGLVARYRPGKGGCYRCLKLHQMDGLFVLPWDQTTGRVQPRGCSDPTFTGAAFDLIPIAAQAVRVAADNLGLSPEVPHDVSLFFARAGEHAPESQLPRWEHHILGAHSKCPICG